jgi:hypothetical protein
MGSHKAVTRANAHAPGEVADYVDYAEVAAPATPASGYVRQYAKTDGKLYQKDDAGTETDLAASGGSSSFVGCRVYNSTTQTIANNGAILTFDSEEFDTSTIHDNSTNPTRLTIPTTGYWRVTVSGIFASNTTGLRGYKCLVNGTVQKGMNRSNPSNGAVIPHCNWTLSLSATNYVEFFAYQNSGGDLAVGHATTDEFRVVAEAVFLGA